MATTTPCPTCSRRDGAHACWCSAFQAAASGQMPQSTGPRRVCPLCHGWADSDTCTDCGLTRWHEVDRDAPDFAKLWATVTAVAEGRYEAFWADHWSHVTGIDWRM